MQYLKKLFDLIENGLKYTVAILCLVLLTSLFIQVMNRYVFGISWPVIQLIIPFCFIWMCMLGSAIGVRRNLHFEVDLFSRFLGQRGQFLQKSLLMLSICAAGALIAYTAVGFAELGLLKKNPATGIQMIYIYVSLVVGGALISLMTIEQLLVLFLTGQSTAR